MPTAGFAPSATVQHRLGSCRDDGDTGAPIELRRPLLHLEVVLDEGVENLVDAAVGGEAEGL